MKGDDCFTRDELERSEWLGGREARQSKEIKHSKHSRIQILRYLRPLSCCDDYDNLQRARPARANDEFEKGQRRLKTLSNRASYDTTKLSDRLNRHISKLQNTCGSYPSAQLQKPLNSRRYARSAVWWSWPGLNRRPRECHSRALPTAPQPHPWEIEKSKLIMENCDVETTVGMLTRSLEAVNRPITAHSAVCRQSFECEVSQRST